MTGSPPPSEGAGRSAGRSGSRASVEGGVLSVRLLQLAQHLVTGDSTQADEEELILDDSAKSAHSTLATLPLACCTSSFIQHMYVQYIDSYSKYIYEYCSLICSRLYSLEHLIPLVNTH